MPATLKKKLLWLPVAVLLAGAAYVVYNTFFIARDYIYGPPVLFTRNRYFELDIYPHGFQSATVFTNSGTEASAQPEDIAIVRLFLKKRGIRGVFFVIPDYAGAYPLRDSPEVVRELEALAADGHEIAQEGTFHTLPPERDGAEFEKLPYDEQKERILQGRDQLTELGLLPFGFRAPEFITTPDTFRVLETCDYLYSSSTITPPRTFGTLFRPALTEGLIYPYHPSGYNLLEFTNQINPLQKFDKSVRLFRRLHALSGVFVYHTYMGEAARPEDLQTLEKFLGIVLAENTWCCTLSELSRWWLGREKLRVETARKGDTFEVTVINRTPQTLPDLGAAFLKYPYGTRRFLIRDGNGAVLAEGPIPAPGKIFLSVPPDPSANP